MPRDRDEHPVQRPRPDRPSRPPERPVLPDRSQDELDVGWGDDRAASGTDRTAGAGDRDDEWYRRERPPHHE